MKQKPKPTKKLFIVRLDESVYARLVQLAQSQGRPVANLAAHLLTQALTQENRK